MRPLCVFAALAPLSASAGNVARTPPMGFNTWNKFGCSVTGQILMDTATAMNATGLREAGYEYVNSDDCWMLAARDSNGSQVANPDKFPNGFKAVADFIHGLGMKSGLYTAKGPNTCAGFAASCQHEVQDALQWAKWGIDYVKDDSCSSCRNNDTLDYMTMYSAIVASGRDMVLTVEGNPDNAACSRGGCGNAKRVGHDISPRWMSMVSLVDIGSGLYVFAHNGTNDFGGWWNDLDMMEIGNSPDFACGDDAAALARCQAHLTMWAVMKAPLIMGNDIPAMTAATLSVLTNAEVLAVNQDPWGVQARRVASQTPRNVSLTPVDAIAVIARCDASDPTQAWTFVNGSSRPADGLYVEPCDASNPLHRWTLLPGGAGLRNAGANACLDASGRNDPGQVLACDATKSSQHWGFNAATGQIRSGTSTCLDVYDFKGPDVFYGSCKQPSDPSISNQVFTLPDGDGLIRSNDTGAPAGSCLAVSRGPPGGQLKTTDAAGAQWCLADTNGEEGTWVGAACGDAAKSRGLQVVSDPHSGLYSIGNSGWNNQPGASGPWPHTRYVEGGWSWAGDRFSWEANFTPSSASSTSAVRASDRTSILDDDLVGGVTHGGDFCLALRTGGTLEVWAGALSGDRIAVALFNRSPADDNITVHWGDVGLAPGATVHARDLWAGVDLGTFSADFTRPVATHATVLLVLTATAAP
jgi:alpha-galactosidase